MKTLLLLKVLLLLLKVVLVVLVLLKVVLDLIELLHLELSFVLELIVGRPLRLLLRGLL